MDQKVFALGPNGIGEPMTLRRRPKEIDAIDSTGARIATAHYLHGTGWIITHERTREVLGSEQYKPDAETRLREIVGQRR